ncbi:hypothetical protein Pmani_006785 [Petrolisthes manimaculis]|uniref:Uncharacterized protein n=1 Tax=Petrolisthes manimaculis TaxID=1843537 RepID=A0AAE1UKR4_9EUCA|nr:hypothetical protein Pmani_006785 [Petrolisthes manimaculis]
MDELALDRLNTIVKIRPYHQASHVEVEVIQYPLTYSLQSILELNEVELAIRNTVSANISLNIHCSHTWSSKYNDAIKFNEVLIESLTNVRAPI